MNWKLSIGFKRRSLRKLKKSLRRSEKSRKLMRSKPLEETTNSTDKSNNNPRSESSQEEILERKKNHHKKGSKSTKNKIPMKTKGRKTMRKALERK